MAHGKAEFMGDTQGGGGTRQKPMPYDQNVLKGIVESGKLV